MTNVSLLCDGQRCNSANYWVTPAQARPGEDSDQDISDPECGLARGWDRPMGERLRGRVRERGPGWSAVSPAERGLVTLQLWAVSCGGHPGLPTI